MEVEQLLSLSGPALAQAISSLLETPGLYVFSDILELPNVREVTHTLTCKHTHKQAHRHSHSQGTALTGGGIARDPNKPPPPPSSSTLPQAGDRSARSSVSAAQPLRLWNLL